MNDFIDVLNILKEFYENLKSQKVENEDGDFEDFQICNEEVRKHENRDKVNKLGELKKVENGGSHENGNGNGTRKNSHNATSKPTNWNLLFEFIRKLKFVQVKFVN